MERSPRVSPGHPAARLLREPEERGHTCAAKLLVGDITQGRAEADHATT